MRKFRLAIPLALVVLLADCSTKQLVEEHLSPEHTPHPVIGNVVQFTLGYNRGSAMGLLPLGEHPRWPLVGLSLIEIGFLVWLLWTTMPRDRARQLAIGLVLGGAMGNLFSRLLSDRGVVDFIDIGFGATRFYVFNVADIGVVVGGILLALVLNRTAPKEPLSV